MDEMSDVKYKVCKVCRGKGGDVVKGWVAVVAVVVAVERWWICTLGAEQKSPAKMVEN